MTIETKSTHVTPAGGNVFADLGFNQDQSTTLKENSQRISSEKLIIKESLVNELAKWINDNQLTQIQAAEILSVSRPRVSDVINRKCAKFTIDALVDMLARVGKKTAFSIS